MNRLFIAFDLDNAGQKIGQATLMDDLSALHTASLHISAGVENARNWIESNGGTVIEIGGDEGRAFVEPDLKDRLEELKQEIEMASGFTVTIGCGLTVSQAEKALIYGKLTGKSKICCYQDESDEIESTLAEAHEHGEQGEGSEDEKKQFDHYLSSMGEEQYDTMSDEGEEEMPEDMGDEEYDMSEEEPSEDEMDGYMIHHADEDMPEGEESEEMPEDMDGEDYGDYEEGDEEYGDYDDSEEPEYDEDEEEIELPEYDEEDEDGEDVDKADIDESSPVGGEDPEENAQNNRVADAKQIALGRIDDSHDERMADQQEEMPEEKDSGGDAVDEEQPEGEAPDYAEMAQDVSPEKKEELKQRIAQNLEMFKQNKDLIEQMKQANPELYESVLGLLQNLIEAAKGLQEPAQKSEKKKKPLQKADKADKYNYYIVHKATGEIHGGNEFRSDAVDASKDQREPASAYKVMHHSKVDPKVKEDFHRKNKIMGWMNKSEEEGVHPHHMKAHIYYQTVSPESAEHGDYEDQGHHDTIEGSPEEIHEHVMRHYGHMAPSSYPHVGPHDWYSSMDPERDMHSGHETYYSVHADKGTHPEALHAFHHLMSGGKTHPESFGKSERMAKARVDEGMDLEGKVKARQARNVRDVKHSKTPMGFKTRTGRSQYRREAELEQGMAPRRRGEKIVGSPRSMEEAHGPTPEREFGVHLHSGSFRTGGHPNSTESGAMSEKGGSKSYRFGGYQRPIRGRMRHEDVMEGMSGIKPNLPKSEMYKDVDMGQADRSLRHTPKGEKGKPYKTVSYEYGKGGSDGYAIGYHLPEGDGGPRNEIYRVQVPKKEYERRVDSITSKHGRNPKSAEIAHEHFKPNLPKSEEMQKKVKFGKLHEKLMRQGYSKERADKIAGSMKAKYGKSEGLKKKSP